MDLRTQKNNSKQLVKYLAMFMSICYLIGPLQTELSLILHEISHVFQMPASILSHKTTDFDAIKVHQPHEHDLPSVNHDHELIDLVDTIFEASKENQETDKKPFTKTKVKKHFTSTVLILFSNFTEPVPAAFFPIKATLQVGHKMAPYIPPQQATT